MGTFSGSRDGFASVDFKPRFQERSPSGRIVVGGVVQLGLVGQEAWDLGDAQDSTDDMPPPLVRSELRDAIIRPGASRGDPRTREREDRSE